MKYNIYIKICCDRYWMCCVLSHLINCHNIHVFMAAEPSTILALGSLLHFLSSRRSKYLLFLNIFNISSQRFELKQAENHHVYLLILLKTIKRKRMQKHKNVTENRFLFLVLEFKKGTNVFCAKTAFVRSTTFFKETKTVHGIESGHTQVSRVSSAWGAGGLGWGG